MRHVACDLVHIKFSTPREMEYEESMNPQIMHYISPASAKASRGLSLVSILRKITVFLRKKRCTRIAISESDATDTRGTLPTHFTSWPLTKLATAFIRPYGISTRPTFQIPYGQLTKDWKSSKHSVKILKLEQ